MKFSIVLICLFISTHSFSQNGLSEENAKAYIDVFFDGFHKGDTVKMKSVMSPVMRMQNVYVNTEGSHVTAYIKAEDFLKAIANRAPDQVWEEKLLDYTISIDGNLAHVWTPYEFWVNGNFSHCGANSFTLVSTDDGWKILNVIDSRRRSGCLD
tara:strand:- start:112 stop:573 length:462 start_codon:yes stop_codon:yes gene_type:complete